MNNRGFTLLELLCALVLTSTLLVAVMGLTGVMARRAETLKAMSGKPDWKARIEQQIRWEFTNSRRFWQTPRELRLQGYPSRDRATDQQNQRPVEIRYALETIDEVTWLTRTETALDLVTNQKPIHELICPHISRLEMALPDEIPVRAEHSGAVPNSCLLSIFDRDDIPMVRMRWIR